MEKLESTNFGTISFCPESVFEFPNGLPGFEDRSKFVPVQNPGTVPILFLQSLESPSLCFTTLPVLVVDPQYQLRVAEQDLETLGFPPGYEPAIGQDVLCLTVVSLRQDGPTANLLAPLVISLKTHRAVQAVAPESNYSHRHALFSLEDAQC